MDNTNLQYDDIMNDKYKKSLDNLHMYTESLKATNDNKYFARSDQYGANLDKYGTYNDPYKGQIDNLYNKMNNFKYDAESDPLYQAYKNQFTREGQAAQDQTISNLTSISGGRNNSWASAATAQVGQAYAQKISDMIPTLAKDQYNKLAQQYQMAYDRSNNAFGRWNDAYSRDKGLMEMFYNMGDNERKNAINQKVIARDLRKSDYDHIYEQDKYKWDGEMHELEKAKAEEIIKGLGLDNEGKTYENEMKKMDKDDYKKFLDQKYAEGQITQKQRDAEYRYYLRYHNLPASEI